ncbi:hypothetical protein B0T26DRAFT_743447 [Lasiosphaeria miniovina]|uniref:Uncharacterized protein n=1 Tax=Lasiosphaeria miniovina TaxID=1954250 RepID=A0AA39ZYC2_9PEZI|nr:uncharacterized protein B0T26DRAFT_743447 [Lasiosphaeria miniovina]KAK0705913.1 hypothetical protein B0T26DRAFT_743447 [Lasiosphaeria miniovina]
MLGKILLTLDAVGMIAGTLKADYFSCTHIFNPRWPPHAKFHGAQTITIAVMLGVATLYYTWWPSLFPHGATPQRVEDALGRAVIAGTLYWVAGLVATLFPGVDGVDPEFGPSGWPQMPFFTLFASLGVLGWAYETWV